MGLETATYIDSLVVTNPDGAVDQRSTADDHIRLLKASTKRTWPNIAGEVSVSHGELNKLKSLTVNVQLEFTKIRTNPANDGTVAYALAAAHAQSASFADSASVATVATNALHANSASFADSASFATKANLAQSASDALALGGVVAARYVDRSAPGTLSGTVHFASPIVKVGAGHVLHHAAAGNISGGAVTVTSTTPAAVFGQPGDIQLVCGPL